jgi:hypothetical protein
MEYFLKIASAPTIDPSKANETSLVIIQLLLALMPRLPPLEQWNIVRTRPENHVPEINMLLYFGLQNCVLQLSAIQQQQQQQQQQQGYSSDPNDHSTDKIDHDLLKCFERLSELFVDPHSHPVMTAEWAQALQHVV